MGKYIFFLDLESGAAVLASDLESLEQLSGPLCQHWWRADSYNKTNILHTHLSQQKKIEFCHVHSCILFKICVSIFCDLLIRALIRFLVASITTEASP